MHLRLQTAIAVTLVMSAITAASAVETGTENDPVCTGRAPFREVAQDEIYTFQELCSMREDFLRADRGRTSAGAIGWARARSTAPAAKRTTKSAN